jgi:hypothetical protein
MAEQYAALPAHKINESISRPALASPPTVFTLLRRFASSDRLTTVWHRALLFPTLTYPFIVPVAI